jgi:hypothetical protein
MINVDIDNIESLLKLGLIKVNLVYPITKGNHFVLERYLSIKLSDGEIIQMPKKFQFDGSSVPRFLWWCFPSYGDFFFAALLHDYLYNIRYRSDELGMKKAQEFADNEMLLWSNTLNKRNFGKKVDNYLRYKAVRWFGKKQYLD